MARVLVTGAAGFIGAALCARLLARGDQVLGLDALTPYYDVRLKEDRLRPLLAQPGFGFARLDLREREAVPGLFSSFHPEAVVHLAAQVGVRHSVQEPLVHVDANVAAFAHVLEGCRQERVGHLVFASSSSVYGAAELPFRPSDRADRPVSLYAATKRAGELLAHSYAHVHRIPCTGLRYFTVYGPWGRPDMAPLRWARAVLEGRTVELYAGGRGMRDLTYVDDAVEATLRALDRTPPPDPRSGAPFRVLNVCGGRPVEMLELLDRIELRAGRSANTVQLPPQAGDLPATWGTTEELAEAIGFVPSTPLAEGVARLVDWARAYYGG